MRAHEFISKSEITPMELKDMNDFTKCSNKLLSGEGIALKNRIVLAVSFFKSLSSCQEVTNIATASG